MKTNLSLRNKPGPLKGKGGRPRKDDALHTSIKVNSWFIDELRAYRKPNERYIDTIRRIMANSEKMKWKISDCDRCKQILDALDE